MKFPKTKIIDISDKVILFSLYAVAFFLPISKAIIESFSILAIVCYISKKIIQGKNVPKTGLNLAIFTYLIICFFSIFISSNLKISARTFFDKVMQNIIFFFVVVDTLNSERRIKNFIYILFLSSLILGIDGIYQYFTHKDFIRNRPYYGLPRIHATFPTSNDFGCYLSSVIPFTLICLFGKFAKFRFKLLRILPLGLFILLFVCLSLTVSRGAWFAFLGSMFFMSMWIHSLGVLLLIIGIIIIVTQQFYEPFLKQRLINFFRFLDMSSTDRDRIWDAAWRMFIYRPWFGLGLGTFMFNFSKFIENYLYGVPYAHNCYLQMAAEIGIIGLVSFLSILVLFFTNGIILLSNQKKAFFWYILLASLTSILGYCIQMAVDTNFYSLDLGMLFWLLLGLGAVARKMAQLEPA